MPEAARKLHLVRVLSLYFAVLLPQNANGDRGFGTGVRAVMEIVAEDPMSTSELGSQLKAGEASSAFAMLFQGVFARAGAVKKAKGVLVNFPACRLDDEEFPDTENFDNSQTNKDWIAVLHFPSPLQTNESASNGFECLLVLDQVKKAVLFGASAIIILTMNPNILKELDVAQIFSLPVTIVEDVNNITVMLRIFRSGLKIRIKVTHGPTFYNAQTFTIWSPCWRARPGSGVVCMSDSRLSKVNPSLFWSYFYSALAVIILLLLIKSNTQWTDGTEDEFEEESIGVVAWQTISSMKIKRYRKAICKYDDSERDTCAICLDQFYRRQKIRILPCIHEFHSKCIDPWLLRHPICPLCKLNVLESEKCARFLPDSGSLLSGW